MSAFLDANEIKERVSLLKFLENLGHRPVRSSGSEHFFMSMLREERTASLCVNDKLGVWFDHGGAGPSGIRSGTVIDFGLAYWYPSTFLQVLEKIRSTGLASELSSDIVSSGSRDRSAVKLPNYKIESVRDIGSNAAISGYLQYRGIWGVADGHLSELYYYVIDDKRRRKDFFAAGHQNENGGWEVRNRYFKGCLGKKGMSFLEGDAARLAVFEGYLDFLSWRYENEGDPASVLVLNSLSFLPASISRASRFPEVEVYFDHDPAGRKATAEFLSSVSASRDCSRHYFGFKDYNEKLMWDLQLLRQSRGADRFQAERFSGLGR